MKKPLPFASCLKWPDLFFGVPFFWRNDQGCAMQRQSRGNAAATARPHTTAQDKRSRKIHFFAQKKTTSHESLQFCGDVYSLFYFFFLSLSGNVVVAIIS
nr:hypothetical protein [Pandoravirus aubagnensis]